jgi:hypothetical protein
MTWTSFAIIPRRRLIATSLMYGLSLTVRMTSATGEEGNAPMQAAQCATFKPGAVNNWPAQPTSKTADLQSPMRIRSCRCHAGCESASPT